MTLNTLTAPPIEREVDGVRHEFRRLTVRDFAVLAERLHTLHVERSQQWLEMLNGSGLQPDQLPMVVRELDRRPSFTETRRWLFTTEGALAAVELTGPSGFDVNAMDYNDAHLLALDVAGLLDGPSSAESGGDVPLSETSTDVATTGSLEPQLSSATMDATSQT